MLGECQHGAVGVGVDADLDVARSSNVTCTDIVQLGLQDVFAVANGCDAVARALSAVASEFAGPSSAAVSIYCQNELLAINNAEGQCKVGADVLSALLEKFSLGDFVSPCQVTTPTSTPTTGTTTTTTQTTGGPECSSLYAKLCVQSKKTEPLYEPCNDQFVGSTFRTQCPTLCGTCTAII